jgi:hypothetical protein
MDLGSFSSYIGVIPDSSNLPINQYGTVYTGMIDWATNDAYSLLDYTMNLNGLSYSLTTSSLSASKTSYLWYRQ